MILRIQTVLLAGLTLFAACRTLPPTNPQSENSAVVALSGTIITEILFISGDSKVEKFYFVQLAAFPEGKIPAGFKPPVLSEKNLPSSIVTSTYNTSKGVYWLNAPPGAYALVGMSYTQKQAATSSSTATSGNTSVTVSTGGGKSNIVTFFSMEFANAHRFVVKPGELLTLGRVTGKIETADKENTDALQKQLMELMSPGYLERSTLSKVFLGGGWLYVPTELSMDTSEGTREEIRSGAIEDFKETEWQRYAQPGVDPTQGSN
ncbi:MAG: hypothetical protein KDK33_19515 [Leptospiraceae bacterium]|nr:hypothetical protein [Leptospiraceae bacterium]